MRSGASLRMRFRAVMPRLSDYASVLPAGTLRVWPRVAAALPADSVLVGGTALAIRFAHRMSADLDFVSPTILDPALIVEALATSGELYVATQDEHLVRGTFDSVQVDIAARPHDMVLAPPMLIEDLSVASLPDIAAGKVVAVAGRRQLRDFVDLMSIENSGGISLPQAVTLYFAKYRYEASPANLQRILDHLVNFRFVADDPFMVAQFGPDIRERTMTHFRDRQPAVATAYQQMLTSGDSPEPPPDQGGSGIDPFG